MKDYVKPQFEYIELTVSESIAVICAGVDFGTTPGCCPS